MEFATPIQLRPMGTEQTDSFEPAWTLNYSEGGFCYSAKRLPSLDTEVCIVMSDYAPERSGPVSFRSYLTRICWLAPPDDSTREATMAGARIIARSHEVLGTHAEKPFHICDMCNAMMSVCRITSSGCDTQLCEYCSHHFDKLPQGMTRKCIERFLGGNVI
ncbi:MAG: hypothetical protein HKP58_15700 [Desulfatitalea sp.]|nr:hypothetical protein [Desulfatitalea sp.]NNK01855.1 hypothetical protein [Desulfatitalea sp.]